MDTCTTFNHPKFPSTAKPVLSGHLKIDKTKVFGSCPLYGGGSVVVVVVVVVVDVDSLLIVTPIVGFCNCAMFCWALLYVHCSFSIVSMG